MWSGASFSSFSSFGSSCFIRLSTSTNRCSMEFICYVNRKPISIAQALFDRTNSLVRLLDVWGRHYVGKLSFTDCNRLLSRISRYIVHVIFSLINTKMPTTDDGKHSQHITLPPPYLIVGIVHLILNSSLDLRQTITFLSDLNKLNLLSSD